jgi:hypothetical protein
VTTKSYCRSSPGSQAKHEASSAFARAGSGATSNFGQILKEVLWCLVTEGGISYRRVRLSYGLDDDAVEERRRELIGIKRLAADVGGESLVRAPESAPPATAHSSARRRNAARARNSSGYDAHADLLMVLTQAVRLSSARPR